MASIPPIDINYHKPRLRGKYPARPGTHYVLDKDYVCISLCSLTYSQLDHEVLLCWYQSLGGASKHS